MERPISKKSRDEEVLEKFLNKKERRKTYFASCGGKKNVTTFLSDLKPIKKDKQIFGILDKDFSSIQNSEIYTLPVYEIENILFGKNSLALLCGLYLNSENKAVLEDSLKKLIAIFSPFFAMDKLIYENNRGTPFCTKKKQNDHNINKTLSDLDADLKLMKNLDLWDELSARHLPHRLQNLKQDFLQNMDEIKLGAVNGDWKTINLLIKGKFLVLLTNRAVRGFRKEILKNHTLSLLSLEGDFELHSSLMTVNIFDELKKHLSSNVEDTLYYNEIRTIFKNIFPTNP